MSLDSISSQGESSKESITLDVDINHVLLVEALQKEKKSNKDIERIHGVVSELKFFSSLFAESVTSNNFENVLKLCSNMKYEAFPMGTFVFKQNDESNDKFYVILSGEVGILTAANYSNVLAADKKHYEKSARGTIIGRKLTRLPQKEPSDQKDNPNSSENENEEDKDEEENSKQDSEASGDKKTLTRPSIFTLEATARKAAFMRKATEKFKEIVKKPVKKKESVVKKSPEETKLEEFQSMAARFGHLVRILGKGEHFGDGALKNPGTKRSASILCKTKCEFLVLDAATYVFFVRANAEKKNQFLLKCFSFISSISSSQIKNKIIYSFSNEGYPEGHMLMEEGAILKQPKLYLIEYGECKLEKMHKIPITNPLNKKEVITTQTYWLPICTVGPGSLLGEEILEYKRSKEHYDYRVTVISTRLSVLTIPKSVFVHIHTELEDQTRLYYHEKRKQRDELYDQLVRELEFNSLKRVEKFLSQHSGVATMLNNSSFKIFTQRALRQPQTASTQLTKRLSNTFLLAGDHSQQKNITEKAIYQDESVWQDLVALTSGKEILNKTSESFAVNKSSYQELILRQQPQSPALTLKLPRADPVDPSSESRKNEIKLATSNKKLKLKEISTNAHGLVESQQASPQKPYFGGFAAGESPTRTFQTEIVINQSSIKEPNSGTTVKPKKRVFSFKKLLRKSGMKTIRMHSVSKREGLYANPRDSEQEIFQNAFLKNLELPEAHDISDADYYKFLFSDDKETRTHLILKQKHSKTGVFAMQKTPDYLKHNIRPSTALVSRLNNTKGPTWIVDDSFLVNSIHSQPAGGAHNTSEVYDRHHSCSYFSPLVSQRQIMTPTEKARESSSTYLVGGILRKSSTEHSQTPQAFVSAASALDNSEKTGRPASQDLKVSPRPPSSSRDGLSGSQSRQRKGTSRISITCKNPIYENLLQKSAVQQKLKPKKGAVIEKLSNKQLYSSKHFLFNVPSQYKHAYSEYY